MIRTPEEDLKRELQDPEYVKLYGASDSKAEIAITLCQAREAAGKTQKELAELMSLSQPYVSKLEGGEANPTIGTIGSILAVLGCRLITNTAPLLQEPTPAIINWQAAVGINMNELEQREPSDLVIAANDYGYNNIVSGTSGWSIPDTQECQDKFVVGGTV